MTESDNQGRSTAWHFVRSRQFGAAVAVLALIVVAIYVFVFTPYDKYLFSDMKSFWVRAMERLDGQPFRDSQFQAWPPVYHIFLAEFFRLLRAVGLESLVRLETALTINIVAFAASVYAFQRLAVHWFDRAEFVLVTVLLYAVGFPSLYFNAFLLSGNLAIPLMIASMTVVTCRTGWPSIVVGALLFGLTTAIRPSFGPYGLAFVTLYLVRHGFNWTFIARAAAFSAVFFALIFTASLEVSRISGGKVNGLSANGGLDFFIANSHYHRIELNYDGWHFFIIVPGLSFKPENGVFYTDVPFYNQGYYFKLGWEFLKHDPAKQLLENFGHVRNLFFADMLPSRFDAPGFKQLRPVWDWFKFLMFATFGLYLWTWRLLGARAPLFSLLMTAIGLTLVVSYFFTGEPRYTYSILFAFYLLFFKLIEQLQADWRRWSKPLAIYGGILAFGVAGTATAMHFLSANYPATLGVNLSPSHPEYEANPQAKNFRVGRLLFPFVREGRLVHKDEYDMALDRPTRVQVNGVLEVKGSAPLRLQFEVNSGWPMQFQLDGQTMMQVSDPSDYFSELVVVPELSPGKHYVEFVFDYEPREGGIAVNYSYWENGWRVRETLGLDTPSVHFLAGEEAVARKH